ncbi:MAG: serine/threonine-protein kinase [bacterium]|nr:serine/threonine-protein kinase [bacterium]
MANSFIGRMLGNTQILRLLGHGGMATVYLGYQTSVDREVAVKVLPPHPGMDPQFVERFRTEARTIARLQHPHILPLYDYGTQDDILYLVMAYIPGGTVADRLAQGSLPLREIERILREIASALDYAHRQGIVHRDIKPANILLDNDGNALLADFGIARVANSSLTGTGTVGTPAYMSPEQARGMEVDGRADIYSLGVVAYQMLCGRPPFSDDTPMGLMIRVIEQEPPDIDTFVSGLPSQVSLVLKRVLAKDPDARYQTATSFADAFSEAIRGARDSMLSVRPTEPVPSQVGTVKFPVDNARIENITRQLNLDQPPTIIVHQGPNTALLLGGFALIALTLVIVVVLLITNQNNTRSGDLVFVPPPISLDSEAFVTPLVNPPLANATAGDTTADAPSVIIQPEALESFGRLTFGSSATLGDSVNLQVENLEPLEVGQIYAAWLLPPDAGTPLLIGELAIDPLGAGVTTYTDPEGRLLPAIYSGAILSVETAGSISEQPGGPIRYAGRVPDVITHLLSETLIASENGLNGGSLLQGALTEANIAVTHSGLAARAGTLGGMYTHAEHTINILRGERVDYDGSGSGSNPGRGIGVYFFVNEIEALLNAAVSDPTATLRMQSDAEFIRVCLANTRQRADRMIELEQVLLAAADVDSVQSAAEESTLAGEQMIGGDDLNANGIIEGFEGECGLEQIETFGILVASMNIVAVPR